MNKSFDEAQAYATGRRAVASHPMLMSLLARAAGPIRAALERGESVVITAGGHEPARYEPEESTMSTIKTAEGVTEAGPDEPALARATQAEENKRAMLMAAGSAGAVAPSQAGILPMGQRQVVTDEAVRRARQAALGDGYDLGPVVVRTMLEAAFAH